jgi:hypothetical protein
MSYYGIKPLRTNDALVAWTNALHIAHNPVEREGVELHLARVKISAGYFDQARTHLGSVTNTVYVDLKNRLTRSLADHEHPSTNSVEEVPLEPLPLPPSAAPPASKAELLSSNLLTMPLPARAQKP